MASIDININVNNGAAKPATTKKEIYDYLVLDRSGSMDMVRRPTFNGINAYLRTLKKSAEETGIKTNVSILLFDDELLPLLSFKDSKEVRELEYAEYEPRGNTALNDAIGLALDDLQNKLRGREKTGDVDVTVTVFTDGYENASTRYPKKGNVEIAGRIKELKNSFGWTVNFVGAGVEAEVKRTALELNIDLSNAKSYSYGAAGTLGAFESLNTARSLKSSNFSKGITSNVNYFVDEVVNAMDNIDPAAYVNSALPGMLSSQDSQLVRDSSASYPSLEPYIAPEPTPSYDSSSSFDSGGCDGGGCCGGGD